jgi:hypothetical protein
VSIEGFCQFAPRALSHGLYQSSVPLRTTPRRRVFKFQLVELVKRLLEVICRGCTMYMGKALV